MNATDCEAFFGNFFNFYANSSTKDAEDCINKLEKDMEEAKNSGKFVVLKEIAFIIYQYYFEAFSKLVDRFDAKLIYLVRHPKPTYVSFHKVLEKDRELFGMHPPIILAEIDREKYEPTWKLYNKHKGHIVIAEELQTEPAKTFKAVFEYIGIEFKEEYLKFEPLGKIGIPDELQMYLHWYDCCINSTEFKTGASNIDSIVIEDSKAMNMIEVSQKFYSLFQQASKSS